MSKSPPESRLMSFSRAELMVTTMPYQQNVNGDLFGGEILSLIDQAAAVAAIRHAGGSAVTASIDRVDFKYPIPIGALVNIAATVDFVGSSSMEITVEVHSEIVSTGERTHTHTAHVVFVAIDEAGKPRRVARLVPETDEERARFESAKRNREARDRS
jgi:acyl-CoA hydrolase